MGLNNRSFGRLRNVALLIVRQEVFVHSLSEFVGGAVFEYLDKIVVRYRIRDLHVHPEFLRKYVVENRYQ